MSRIPAFLALALLVAGSGCAQARIVDSPATGTTASEPADAQPPRPPQLPPIQRPRPAPEHAAFLPSSASQGALVMGRADPSAIVVVEGRHVRVSADGRFVFGVGRDAVGPLVVRITAPDGGVLVNRIAVTPRDWPIERIDGVPPTTVNPPPAIAARIEREQAMVVAARARDDARTDFAQPFIWPVQGRISGRFGNQRVYNGTPKSPHSGMDIAAASGTLVKAPAAGVISFAAPDLYLTGGTVVLDHGQGVSSNFLHLSRIDAKVGDRVEQGQVIGAVGATGRATGPHLHWGMNWFDVRIDPLLVLER
jgi:biotin carboxyl carrier protein